MTFSHSPLPNPGPDPAPAPPPQPTGKELAAMLAAMAAAIATLMVWTSVERRFFQFRSAPFHYVSLAAGVLLSVAAYTAINRAFGGPRK